MAVPSRLLEFALCTANTIFLHFVMLTHWTTNQAEIREENRQLEEEGDGMDAKHKKHKPMKPPAKKKPVMKKPKPMKKPKKNEAEC